MNDKYAICITVYKNRQTRLLEHLPNVDKKYDIYIVAQENDSEKNEYYNFCVQDNIHVLICNANNIFKKRQYILNEMRKLKYTGFFMLDDDVLPDSFVKVDKNIKRTTSDTLLKQKCDINEILDVCIERSNEYNVGICGFINQAFMGYCQARECVINKSFTQYCFVFINYQCINATDINYDTSGLIHEDLDLVCQALQHGINIGTIETHSYNFVYGKTTLMINDEPAGFVYKCETAHKWHIPIYCRKVKNSDDPKIYFRFKPALYFNTKELPKIQDATLNRLSEEKKYKEVYKYLKQLHASKQNKKSTKCVF